MAVFNTRALRDQSVNVAATKRSANVILFDVNRLILPASLFLLRLKKN